ncbi:MAG TPA: choice-of-anchor D domain-containing protein, partial [Terriglobia bacterium]
MRLKATRLHFVYLGWLLFVIPVSGAGGLGSAVNRPDGQVRGSDLGSSVGLVPQSLTFPSQQIWTTSAAQKVTVTNEGATILNFVSIVASGDYSETNNCGSSLQPGASCLLHVKFGPSASGARTGSVTLSDSDATVLQTVTLTGTGFVPTSNLAVSPGVASITFGLIEQFKASINGVKTSNVTWGVDGIVGGNSTVGTISASGLYTPPATAGPHTVSATTTKPAQTASARLVVTNYTGTFSWHNDAGLTGQNLNETVLTTGNVNSNQFGKLFSLPVDGQAYAQTLYVQGLKIPGQGTHNVIYVATENDSVYAFDGDGRSQTALWHVSFISPPGVTTVSSTAVNCTNIGSQVGITSTPVIDPVRGVLYVLAVTAESENGNQSVQYVQRLHALDIATGAEELGGPVVITASVPGTGEGSVGGVITFDPLHEEQRSALALVNGVVYLNWASYCDNDPYHGWTLGYDGGSLAQVSVFNTSPNGTRVGTWESGSSTAADADGNLFLTTGNGTFDASTGGLDYGETYLKLSTASGLNVADYFTPYDQAADTQADLDAGSGGPLLMPDQPAPYPHLMVGAGKEGTIYLINRDDMGGYNPNNNNQIVQSLTAA